MTDTAPAPPAPPADSLTPAERSAAAAGTLAYDADHPPSPAKPVPKWAVHRRLYDWVIGFAKSPYATTALAGLSFAESSFFPIPPDVLLMPLVLGSRKKAWWFAAVCTLASVLGGVAGYYIGFGLWEATRQFWFSYVPGFTPAKFEQVRGWYESYGVWVVFGAAFTPIPYKVFTITSGVVVMNLPMFILASVIGRGLRFFLVAALMWRFGARIVPFVDRWFNLLTLAAVVLGVGGFLVFSLLH